MCHAARTEIGHGDDFLELFTFLAKRAIDAGALGVFSEYLGIRGIREHACEVESACVRLQSAWRARCVRLWMHDEWMDGVLRARRKVF